MAQNSKAKKVEENELPKFDVPTVKSSDSTGWRICNTVLGCGLHVLQGWSSGVGIKGNETTFETKFFKLLYASKLDFRHQEKYLSNRWSIVDVGRPLEAPIAVSNMFYQFLSPKQTYICSSTIEWVNRFEDFIKKYGLGELGRGHVWKNKNYKNEDNVAFTWTWNGKVPKAEDVGIKDWEYPQ